MSAPERPDEGDGTARLKAARAVSETAAQGPLVSIAWSLLSIAGDLAAIRRELHWQGQRARRG